MVKLLIYMCPGISWYYTLLNPGICKNIEKENQEKITYPSWAQTWHDVCF